MAFMRKAFGFDTENPLRPRINAAAGNSVPGCFAGQHEFAWHSARQGTNLACAALIRQAASAI
jgi:hypothetical protein